MPYEQNIRQAELGTDTTLLTSNDKQNQGKTDQQCT